MERRKTQNRGRIRTVGYDSTVVEDRAGLTDWDQTDSSASRGRLQRAWLRFKRDRSAVGGSILILGMVLLAIFARPIQLPATLPLVPELTVQPFALAPYPPAEFDYGATSQPPSGAHLFGTDWAGRDIFSRVLYGGRWSLTIGFIAVGLAVFIGIPVGAIAGYYGGVVDSVLMRIVDVLYAFPFIVLAITVIAIVGRGFWNLIFALTIVGWLSYARIIRGEILSVKEMEYVAAAKVLGARDRRVIFRHIVPNAISPVIVTATLSIGSVVLTAAALGFLGLGLEPGTAEWGSMLSRGRDTLLAGRWWVTLFPGVAIFVFVMAINLVGDGLRDALNPQGDEQDEEHRGKGV